MSQGFLFSWSRDSPLRIPVPHDPASRPKMPISGPYLGMVLGTTTHKVSVATIKMTPQEHKQELKKHRETPREDQKPCISKVLHPKVVKYRRWFFKNISRIRPVRSKRKNNAWKTRRFHDDCEETRAYLNGHTIIDHFVTRDGTPYFGCLEYEDMWIPAATYMRMHAPKGVYFIMTCGLIYEEDCWQGLKRIDHGAAHKHHTTIKRARDN